MSLDISSMYPNMSVSRTLRYLSCVLTKFMRKIWPRDMIGLVIMLTRVILETLVVEFDGNLYLQIRGTAMGTNCAPQLANIFGFWLEHLALGNAPPGWILYLYCYIEDVFLAVRNQEAARWVLNHLNGVTPMIVYSGEVSERSMAYLDLCISTGKNFLGTGVLETSTYCKPSSQMKYYPIPSSYHYPPHL